MHAETHRGEVMGFAPPLQRNASRAAVSRRRSTILQATVQHPTNEITTIDHALTRPWTVTKKYVRQVVKHPEWLEEVCTDCNGHVDIAGQNYFLSAVGLLMPARKDQPPPDLRYFNTQN
jgi:hypothetical protein